MARQYHQISQEERNEIFLLLSLWFNKKQISYKLNRHPSTITRELQRNSSLISSKFNSLPIKQPKHYHYLPDTAQNKRNIRRKNANYRPPCKNPQTLQFVIQYLQKWWSPDIISWTLKKLHKYNKSLQISHEAIYQFIYTKKWEELWLKNYLTRKHKRRKKKTWRTLHKSQKIPNRTDITERKKYFPKLEKRKEFWHFEWDSILSKRTTYSALRTETERKSRFIFCLKIPKKTAELTKLATLKIFSQLPRNSIKSTTWDNGSEHSQHEQVTEQTSIKIFFAEPYKSWQRWTNEHANGMIRRFFPKWTNFDKVTDEEIQQVVDYLNNRPRKILNYRTPKEVFQEYLNQFNYKLP